MRQETLGGELKLFHFGKRDAGMLSLFPLWFIAALFTAIRGYTLLFSPLKDALCHFLWHRQAGGV